MIDKLEVLRLFRRMNRHDGALVMGTVFDIHGAVRFGEGFLASYEKNETSYGLDFTASG